jgi:hypothetical protein
MGDGEGDQEDERGREIRQRTLLIEFCSNSANHPEQTSRRKSGRGIRQSLSNQSVGRCRPVNHGCYLLGLAGQSSERTQVEWVQWNLSESEWSMGGNEHITLVVVMRSSREAVAGWHTSKHPNCISAAPSKPKFRSPWLRQEGDLERGRAGY